MKRVMMGLVLAVAGSGCVSVPGSESYLAAWDNGVTMTQRTVTYWYGASPTEKNEAWVRNDSGGVQCLALKASNTSGYAKTWVLQPGSNQVMWPELSEYELNRFVAGSYGSWRPWDGATCDSAPGDVQLQYVGLG